MQAIITVLDNITETSMPFNEFVLYRANHYPEEKHILLICSSPKDLPQVTIPAGLEIIYLGKNPLHIRKTITNIITSLKKNRIKYIIHLHQVQSGCLTELSMIGTGLRKKTIFTVHSTFSGYKIHNKILSFINTLLAQIVICVSKTSYLDYPSFIKWIKGTRIKYILNGVDNERIDRMPPQKSQRDDTFIKFIYVARLIPIKNHDFLLKVLARCAASIHFVFVGKEDEGKHTRKRAEELGLSDRITFTGLIPRHNVFDELHHSDYYISASTLEGLPISVLEAMYCGLPCVLSDIPQHREAGADIARILPFDADKWACELNHLASLSRDERIKLGEKSKEHIISNFTLGKMHGNYDKIYKLLL